MAIRFDSVDWTTETVAGRKKKKPLPMILKSSFLEDSAQLMVIAQKSGSIRQTLWA